MAEFILIGSNEKMQEIVTGIREYQPQSTCLNKVSTGIILHSTDGAPEKYHSVDTNKNTEDNQSLENYLLNQLAHHRANATTSNAAVNLFLLCSLFDKQDIDDIKFLYNGLRSLIGNDTNVTVTWVLFSFDIQSPDVKRRASTEDIEYILKLCKGLPVKEENDLPLFVNKVLYINNRDMDNAAVDLNGICNPYNFIVDFLSGFFYLSSNPSDEYDIINSCGGDIFSIGYADYAYRPQDISQYLSLQLQFNRLNDIFKSRIELKFDYSYDNVEEAIDGVQDIAQVFPDPQGLENRKTLLDSIYLEPDFDTIGEYRELSQDSVFAWIFGAQDYYLQKMKPFVENYNNYCDKKYNEANEKYEKACKEAQEKDVEIPNRKTFFAAVPEPFEYFTWSEVLNAYPKGKITKAEAKHLNEIFAKYNNVKANVLTDVFFDKLQSILQNKNYEETTKASDGTQGIVGGQGHQGTQENAEYKSGCLLSFLNLFKRKLETNTNELSSEYDVMQPPILNEDEILRECWSAFNQLEKSKTIYADFSKAYQSITAQKEEIEGQINKFQVYEHKKSVSLIEVDKLQDFYSCMLQTMLSTLETLRENGILFETLYDVQQKTNRVTALLENSWNTLNWENPFIFIKDMSNLVIPIENMQQNNSVFIDIKQDSTNNVLQRMYLKIYSNSEQQIDTIKTLKDNRKIRNSTFIIANKSNHIINRICMYRIINVTSEELKDLQ